MAVTIFTNGSARYRTREDGIDVLSIDFEEDHADDSPEIYRRHELRSGARIETNGAVAESFGRGGTVLEVVSLASLQERFPDEKVLSEASGSCRRTTNDQGLWVCDQGSCSGSCAEKCILIFCWCSCS